MTQEYQKLKGKITQARRRLRWIVLAKGFAYSLIGILIVLSLVVYCADHWNYSDHVLFLGRILSVPFALGIFGWFLARPLMQKVKDAQIARYIEERHPALKDRLVTAVELGEKEDQGSPSTPILPLLVHDAVQHSNSIQANSLFNPREPFLSGAIGLGLILSIVLLQLFGPDYFHYATKKLYANWLFPQAAPLYRLEVKPGDTLVRKGSDQLISARLLGFDYPEVSLFSRFQRGDVWEKNRMESQRGSNTFGFLFLDINEKVRYYVQAGNVKSPEFTINVTDTVRVEKIDLTYRFPRYTGLPSKREEDGGEISAVKGTQVEVEAVTNTSATAARILLQDGMSIPMQKIAEKNYRGRIEVIRDSTYKIELTDSSKTAVIGSHEYNITALEDQPPVVSFLKPGRDKRATKLEEVLTEVKAEDDFGVNALELHFNVNGGKENVVELFQQKSGATPKSISGTHTYFLEEYNLEPGDFITYFATASDARNTTTSDIYFLEVRPFGKEFSQSQVAGGMGGGAGDPGSVLSARQKEILAATWRLIRDRKSFSSKEYTENLKLITTSQEKLQQQTKTLSNRIQRRALSTQNPESQELFDNLVKAVEAMTPAHQLLSQDKLHEAVPPEQTALQHLMRAEARFKEIQVAFGNGSSGQNKSLGAEDLEGLFELELDKLKNQYETLQQRSSMQANDEVDEAARKLKDLAHRQQQLNERQRQNPLSRSFRGGGSGASDQQTLQSETEKLARQLERLSRDTQDDELMKASQRLKQAAQEMRNQSQNGSSGDSENRGLQALTRLNDARQLLDTQQRNNLSDDLTRLHAAAEDLTRQQQEIQSGLEELVRSASEKSSSAVPPDSAAQVEKDFSKKRQIFQGKSELKNSLESIERNLFSSARKAGSQQKATSEKLQSAGNALRDNRIQEKVDQGGQLIARGLLDSARQREQNIQGMLEDLKQRIGLAGKSLNNSGNGLTNEEKLGQALGQTGDLIGNLDSLNRRIQQFRGARTQKGDQRTGGGSREQNGKDPTSGREQSTDQAEVMNQDSQANQDGSMQGQHPGGRQNPNRQGKGQSPESLQTRSESNSSAGGSHGAEGEYRQDVFGDQEQQNFGGTNFGNASVNFGDRKLPPPGKWSPDQVRQFEKEYQLRLKEAQEIGKNLTGQPDLATQLKNIVERMKQMSSMKFLVDDAELERLRSHVIEGFRQLELDLSKNLEHLNTKENLHLAKDEEIPEAYRKQVEDYYKALSRER